VSVSAHIGAHDSSDLCSDQGTSIPRPGGTWTVSARYTGGYAAALNARLVFSFYASHQSLGPFQGKPPCNSQGPGGQVSARRPLGTQSCKGRHEA
jgi:hypothetical protein